ncbi:MAG: CSLREA domain-containing protein [Bryobacteraceae bacterium]
MNKRFLVLSLIMAAACSAQTLTVNTTLDTIDPSDGVLSLREAIIAVNNRLDSTGRCLGVTNIAFQLSATNAIATYGATSVPYYKIKINYHDPDYAKALNRTPGPTALPHVRCPIYLDGYTQPGSKSGSPLIEISGEDLPLNFIATPDSLRGDDLERSTELLTLDGRLARQPEAGDTNIGCGPTDPGCPLKRSASGSTIRGLMFNYAPQTGLGLFGADNVTITGNYFGLDATGENPAPNGRRPEDIRLFSLHLNGASKNTIGTPREPNFFGVARSHSIILWPFTAGDGECGPTSPANAVCSRYDIGSAQNTIQANYFGLNRTGTRSLGGLCVHTAIDRRFVGENGCAEGRTPTSAVYTSGGPQIYVFFYPTNIPLERNSMRNNLIGGRGPREGNFFAAAWTAISLRAIDTEIIGNTFGLDVHGIGARDIAPFTLRGIQIFSDSIGTLVESNIIANSALIANATNAAAPYGNGGGVNVGGMPTGPGFSDDLPPVIVRRNLIGVNFRGEHPGLNLLGLPATNAGGGATSTWMLPMIIEKNVIAYNGYIGLPPIAARDTVINPNTANEQYFPPRRIAVLSNSMFCNGKAPEGQICGTSIGIDWSASRIALPPPAIGDGPTLNDDGDTDDGPAELLNYPILSSTATGVTGRLNTKPNTRIRVQLFSGSEEFRACAAVTTTIQPGFQSDPACSNTTNAPAFLSVQGETLLTELEVTTGADGTAQFSANIPANLMVTATATQLAEDGRPLCTSEFSQAVKSGKP